jgi:hypothetical protein
VYPRSFELNFVDKKITGPSLGPGDYDPDFSKIKSKSPNSIMCKEKRSLERSVLDEQMINPIYKFLKEFKSKSEGSKRIKSINKNKKVNMNNTMKTKDIVPEEPEESGTYIFKSQTNKMSLTKRTGIPGPGISESLFIPNRFL